MNIAIITCFSAEHRLDYIKQAMIEEGHNVSIITSDFKHIKKEKIIEKDEDKIYVDTIKYKKNLSIRRIYSHYNFANKVIKQLKKMNLDLIYCMIPPNFLAKKIIKYKEKQSNIKVIFDIIDLWPETLPGKNIKNKLKIIFNIWRNLRDKNINKADMVFTECELYQKILKNQLPNNTQTLYLADNYVGYKNELEDKQLVVSYLGSINNIVDIDFIVDILKEIKKIRNVKLNIIGDGENRETLLNKLKEDSIDYTYYGKIYDEKTKYEIFNKSHLGMNIMKEDVCVGLTMKSIEYFKFGLPIINNIKEDTTNIVEKYNIGFNVNKNNIEDTCKKIGLMNMEDFLEIKKNVKKMYSENFEIEILKNKIKENIRRIN